MKKSYRLTMAALLVSGGMFQGLGSAQDASASREEALRRQRLSTPRKTLENFLKWQNPPLDDPTIAAEAWTVDATLSQQRRERLARQLKAVLDGRGLFVNLSAAPDEPDYVDPTSGQAEYTPFPNRLPSLFLIRIDEEWLFAPATVAAVPGLYAETYSRAAEYLVNLLPPTFHRRLFGVAIWQYVGLFLMLLLGLLIRKLADFFLNRFAQRMITRAHWEWIDATLLRKLLRPVSFVLMVGFLILVYRNLQLSVQVNLIVNVVLELMAAGSLIWLVFGLVDLFSVYLTGLTARTESKLDDQLVPLLRKSLKVFACVLGGVTVVQNYGFSVSSILAGLGVGGLAVALAAKETLANFFGSITIFVDKPFQVGDWVVMGKVEGVVEEVGFRSTRIRTFYDSVVSVPNASVTDSSIDNYGLRKYRRVSVVLGLPYSTTPDQMEAFVVGVRAIIAANKHMRKDFYEVHFNGFGASSLDVLVYCFLKTATWTEELREKHNFFLEILRLAEEIGVEFAFPTQTLHVDHFHRDRPRRHSKSLSPSELGDVVSSFGPQGERARPDGPVITFQGEPIDFTAASLQRQSS